MKFSSINIDACIAVERFCKASGIKFEVIPVDTDGEEIYLYDLTILNNAISVLVREKDVHIYDLEHDVYVDRNAFVTLTFI